MSPSDPYMVEPYEFILVYSKKFLQNKAFGRKPDITKEEFIQYSNSFWDIKPETNVKEHPAAYPEELVYRLVKFYSYVGDTILDPFLGSGTTLKVCKNTNRNGIGIEMDSKYVTLAMSRLNGDCEVII
jgi:site-specific DNA-methyltransferase (adenine-specific)